ncbi:putative esterase YheT [Gracilariopsis chorda]|uniref:Putative esterase YheT n=1 Tax=Gracilariopsis chorda TaxID=448386 RepID=A0A2V3IEG4_9FLOR|nr:putative esterase YheT [Gracilariopsis chorda]|eukprot:PXF40479.1 putative esterase YheT [Gracilariopsis chorda]
MTASSSRRRQSPRHAFQLPVSLAAFKRRSTPAHRQTLPATPAHRAPPVCAHPALADFKPLPFRPYLFSNPHFQTIFAHFYPKPPAVHYKRLQLRTADRQSVLNVDLANGTGFAADCSQHHQTVYQLPPHFDLQTPLPKHWKKPPPVAVVLHGLESNSTAIVSKRIVAALEQIPFKVFVLNYRSCAKDDAVPSTLRLYHAGFTEDLETLLKAIRHAAIQAKQQPPDVYLAAFSLGANITCQFLGTHKQNALTQYGVVAAAVACVPFDPCACQRKLDSGFNGAVYSARLVSTMRNKFQQAVDNGVSMGAVNPDSIRTANRVGLIDDVFIAPVFGFKDRFDYYHQVDARKVLSDIHVPTYIINSQDDPFFDHKCGKSLPTIDHIGSAPVLLNVTRHGGHCGFLDKSMFTRQTPGYFQNEFARFFTHVRQRLEQTQHEQQRS